MHEPADPQLTPRTASLHARLQLLKALAQREAENCLELQYLQLQLDRLQRRAPLRTIHGSPMHDCVIQPRRAA
jgi:hypothetical protein